MNKQFIIFRYYVNDELLNQDVKLVDEDTINTHLSYSYFLTLDKWDELVTIGEITLISRNNKIVLTCF